MVLLRGFDMSRARASPAARRSGSRCTSRGHDASVLEKQAPGRRSGRAQRWDDAIPCPLQVIHVKLNEPEVKITVDLSVDRIIVPMSCPPRGILARCRGGGAGCGTRERDATHVT